MPWSNYTHQALQNSLAGKTSNFGALASRPTWHVGLSTTTPTMAGGNVTEPSGNGYARVATAPADWGNATNADPSEVSNAVDILFPEVTGSGWGTITHFVIYDAASAGNFLGFGALTTPKTPTVGDEPFFDVGELDTRLAS